MAVRAPLTVDQEEEGARLVGYSARDQRFAGTGRAVQQDTTRRLHTDRLRAQPQVRSGQGNVEMVHKVQETSNENDNAFT